MINQKKSLSLTVILTSHYDLKITITLYQPKTDSPKSEKYALPLGDKLNQSNY